MEKKKSSRFWLVLILFSLIGQVAWVVENMYFNVFIYNMFSASAGEISAMVAASSIVATVTTIFVGALSDKLGRRKIFISLGYVLWGISILGFTLVREDIISAVFPTAAAVSAICIVITIILDCIMTFFGSSANDAAFNAWLTDETEEGGRGKAEGINAMMPLVAILVVFGGFMSFDLTLASSWTSIFAVIGTVVTLIGISSFFLIKEEGRRSADSEYLKNLVYSFKPSTVKKNYLFYLTILAFAVFGIAIQIFMPYLIIYYEVSLALDNYVLIMAPAIIIAAIITVFFGRFYDKAGFATSAYTAIATLAVGFVILSVFTNTALVFIGSLFMMTGYLAGMAVFGAMLRDRTPKDRAGAFQGIRIIGQVLIPGIIGPAIGALVLSNAKTIVGSDGREQFIPNRSIFLAALAVTVLVALSVYAVSRAMKKAKDAE